MIAISAHEIHKYYGANHVLKGLSFEVYGDEKVGLLGRNGSGKTTMFKVITGEEPAEGGSLSKASGKKVEMLAQIPAFGENDTVEDVLRSSFQEVNDVYKAMKAIEGDGDPSVLKRYGRLMEEYERLGGYDTEVTLDKVCGGMNLGERIRQSPFHLLSGGEKTRVNLARILLRDCDILLLDEPTNHLDISSLEWLERFLRDYPGTVVTVSHDRVFLDRVVSRIIEIEEGKANFYSGNYSWYVEEKRRRFTSQSEQYDRQQKEIKRIEDRAKWFVEQNQFTTKHHALLSRLDHMDKVDKPVSYKRLTGDFDGGGYVSKEIVSLDAVSKRFGDKTIVRDLDLKIYRNQRIALIGPNGCGKSTLLKMIMGEAEPDGGAVKIAPSVKPAYMSQIITFDDPDASVLDTLRHTLGVTDEKARSILAAFHFRAADVHKKVGVLSGGEKSRLRLCIMMQEKVNFLCSTNPRTTSTRSLSLGLRRS
jgi:ATPase subunit of ABC transporter with duplicated ATPase domains